MRPMNHLLTFSFKVMHSYEISLPPCVSLLFSANMTSKCCREKAVLVAVYAERPKRRLPLSENNNKQGEHHHHHYHHLHENISQNDGTRRKGYNRRAELLDYARHLRSSAQPSASASATSSSSSRIIQISTLEISAANETPNRSSPPTCLDKWKFLIPRFLRSIRVLKITKVKEKKKASKGESAATKVKALVKKLQVQKKGSLLSQLLKKLQKRR